MTIVVLCIGWVIFGTCMTVSSFFIALFPRTLKKNEKNGSKEVKQLEQKAPETIPKLSGL